jgi:hypothetical protein
VLGGSVDVAGGGVDSGGITVAMSTGQTSASTPPITNDVQLGNGASGNPAKA